MRFLKCKKTVTRHIWQRFVEMTEDVRHTPLYRDIYKLRQQKIERVFADAKEKHGMRYTHYRSLTQVANWVKLKFATMNLKKLPLPAASGEDKLYQSAKGFRHLRMATKGFTFGNHSLLKKLAQNLIRLLWCYCCATFSNSSQISMAAF